MEKKSKIFFNYQKYEVSANKKHTHTRKINPALGMLGFLGFLGLCGFLPRIFNLTDTFTAPTFFMFFGFFGFFGFYYEGKMSDTFIDERFILNSNRATAIANKISLLIIFLVSILSMSLLRLETYDMLSLLLATIGLSFGLSIFLSMYLLYKFENEE